MVAPVEEIEPALTLEIRSPAALLTVTLRLTDAVLFAESVAMAVIVCEELVAVVVFHEVEYVGPGPVIAEPRLTPSI
jgi:hypothetical protein